MMCECRWKQPVQNKQKGGQLQRRITEHKRNTKIGDKSRSKPTEGSSSEDYTIQRHKEEFINKAENRITRKLKQPEFVRTSAK
jgi:hypothetical protein